MQEEEEGRKMASDRLKPSEEVLPLSDTEQQMRRGGNRGQRFLPAHADYQTRGARDTYTSC